MPTSLRFLLRRRALKLAAALAALPLAGVVQAQGKEAAADWPSQPLRIIVGFPAGSSPDLTARAIADPLAQALGQPVVVENRVGAGGNIGAEAVARASDGHTVGLMINGNMTVARLINPAVRYDPLKDLAPVSLLGVAPLVLAAPVQHAQAGDARAFLQAARAAGEQWNYGSPGVGTVGHIGMELLKNRAGIAAMHVPYPGYSQVAQAMVAGDLHLSMLPPGLAQAQIAAGKLRAVGLTSSGRSPLAPDIASLSELGVKNFNLEIWNALAAPAGMPKAHIEKLAAAVSGIVRSPAMRQRLFQQGWQVVGSSPEALARRVQSDTAALGEIIRAQNIKAE